MKEVALVLSFISIVTLKLFAQHPDTTITYEFCIDRLMSRTLKLYPDGSFQYVYSDHEGGSIYDSGKYFLKRNHYQLTSTHETCREFLDLRSRAVKDTCLLYFKEKKLRIKKGGSYLVEHRKAPYSLKRAFVKLFNFRRKYLYNRKSKEVYYRVKTNQE